MAAQGIEVDAQNFNSRINQLYKFWKESRSDDSSWKKADALIINTGKPKDDAVPEKSNTLHNWLFGYEFPETIIVFCESKVSILASSKKVAILQSLLKPAGTSEEEKKEAETPVVPLELISKADETKEQFDKLISDIKGSFHGKAIGVLSKESPEGTLIQEWFTALKDSPFEQVDVSYGYAEVLATKDSRALKAQKTAAAIATHVLLKDLLPSIETVIDEGHKMTHKELSDKTAKLIADPSKISKKLSPDSVDACYPPIVQSGGSYEFKPGAEVNTEPLHFGTIVCAAGVQYKSFCANLARTYFVDPTKDQENSYKFLLDIEQLIFKTLKPGTPLSTVMSKVLELIENKDPTLVDKFSRNCGFGMGIEFQETAYILNTKNPRTVKPGMVFNISIAFKDLETEATDPKKQK